MKAIYESEYLQLGLKIAYYRKLRGLTQEELAEKLIDIIENSDFDEEDVDFDEE